MKYLFSILYGAAVRLRVILYESGVLQSRKLRNPVISVGNLTVGGTGKTPLVAFLAQVLLKAGYQPVVLSRGYKGKSRRSVLLVSDGKEIFCNPAECGDEPYLLARKLEGVPVVVGKNRYQAGRFIEDHYPNVIHLLDDGFQHLQLHRDLDILILDATDPFGGGRLLPAGRLREGLEGIRRANWIIISRSHISTETEQTEIEIRKYNRMAPVSYFYHDVSCIYDTRTGVPFRTRDFLGKPVIALAAIGHPEIFLHDLAHYQIKVIDHFIFRDHHQYTQPELDRVRQHMKESKAEAILTTEKDAVRLQGLDFEEGQIFAVQIEPRAEDLDAYKKDFLSQVEFLRKSA